MTDMQRHHLPETPDPHAIAGRFGVDPAREAEGELDDDAEADTGPGDESTGERHRFGRREPEPGTGAPDEPGRHEPGRHEPGRHEPERHGPGRHEPGTGEHRPGGS